MNDYTLTEEQVKIASEFLTFLLNPDDTYFIIKGPARAGKTVLLKHLVEKVFYGLYQGIHTDKIDSTKPFLEVILTATNNKAVAALPDLTTSSNCTIHKLLGLVVQRNKETGQTYLKPTRTDIDNLHGIVVFIDEASMLDRATMSYLVAKLSHTKVVLIGDPEQLLPVKHNYSPAFTVKSNFSTRLTKVHHTINPHIAALITSLRESVRTGKMTKIQLVPGSIGWIKDKDHVLDDMRGDIYRGEGKVLAYTNATVIKYNQLTSKSTVAPYMSPGDIVTLNSSQALIFAAVMQTVVKTDESMHLLEVKTVSEPVIDIYVDEHASEPIATLNGYLIKAIRRANGMIISRYVPDDYKLYKKYVDNPSVRVHARTHVYTSLNGLANYAPNSIRDVFIDVRLSNASTVHKGQGSGYPVVYLDVADLCTCRNLDTFRRLLYVGASRAQRKLIFVGELPPKFKGMFME